MSPPPSRSLHTALALSLALVACNTSSPAPGAAPGPVASSTGAVATAPATPPPSASAPAVASAIAAAAPSASAPATAAPPSLAPLLSGGPDSAFKFKDWKGLPTEGLTFHIPATWSASLGEDGQTWQGSSKVTSVALRPEGGQTDRGFYTYWSQLKDAKWGPDEVATVGVHDWPVTLSEGTALQKDKSPVRVLYFKIKPPAGSKIIGLAMWREGDADGQAEVLALLKSIKKIGT